MNELFGVFRHASSGLYREGKEVRLLCSRQLLVLVVLAQCGLVGGGEGLGAGCRQMRGSKGVRDDDIGEDGPARHHDVQIWSTAIFGAEA